MTEHTKSSQSASIAASLPNQPEDITEHMTRSEMIADIMCMLADADIATLRRVMDEAVARNTDRQ